MSIGAAQRYYLKLKASHYCYEKGYTQSQAAKMLGISRNTLGKMLTEARQEGIVQVKIVDIRNTGHFIGMETQLMEQYGLLDVKIVDCVEESRSQVNSRIAEEAARYVERILTSGMRVGLAWGRTLDLMVRQMRPNSSITGLEVTTLLGSGGTITSRVQPGGIVQRFLEKFDGKGYIINAPYFCRTAQLCATLKQEPHIREVLDRARQSDIALVGIGERPTMESCAEAGLDFTPDIVRQLGEAHAVGDICNNFFDVRGELCRTELIEKLLAVELADFARMGRVIALAGGANKSDSVLGALRGKYIDVLITDPFTAKKVLEPV